MKRIPSWLRSEDLDVDRVLLSAWLRLQDEHDAAQLLLASVTDRREVDGMAMDELAETITQREACWDDPALFALTEDGLSRSPSGCGWDAWAIQRCDGLESDAMDIAHRIAHPARLTVAATR